jgi:hypothetical protein
MYRRYAVPFRHGRGHLVAAAWRRNREVSMALIRRKIFNRSQVTPRDERPATSLGFVIQGRSKMPDIQLTARRASFLGGVMAVVAIGISVAPLASADPSDCQVVAAVTVCAQGSVSAAAQSANFQMARHPSIGDGGGCMTQYGTYEHCRHL